MTRTAAERRYAWYVVGVLLLVSVIGYVDRLVLGFLVEPIKADLDLTDTQIGLITGLAFALLYVVMGVPLGRLIDGRHRIAVVAGCIAVWSLCTAACGAASNFAGLFLARVGVGAGEAGLNPGAVSLIGDYFPQGEVAKPIGIFSMGIYVGGGIALILGGQLAAYFASLTAITLPFVGDASGWRAVFYVVGLPGLAVALLFAFTVRDPRRDTRRSEAGGDANFRTALAFARQHARLLSLLTGAFVAFGFNIYALLGWYPAMLTRTFGLDAATIAATYGPVYLVAGTVGALLLGPATGWLRARGFVDASVLLCTGMMMVNAAAAVAAPLMPGPYGWLLPTALVMVSWAIIIGSSFAIIAAIVPPACRGVMTGVYLAIMNLSGGAFGTVLVGLLTDHWLGAAGLNVALSAVAAIFGPAAVVLFWFARPAYRAMLAAA